MATTTNYGSWYNHTGEATVSASIAAAVAEFADDFDLDAIESDYLDAIDEALPSGVGLSGDQFLGPAYEDDQDFDGYPLDDFGALDIKAIIADIDLMAIVERHELWTADDAAGHLGYKGDNRAATARKKLSSWGIKAHSYRSHPRLDARRPSTRRERFGRRRPAALVAARVQT